MSINIYMYRHIYEVYIKEIRSWKVMFCHLLFQMYITNTIKAKGTRLAKPVLCLGLMCLAFLTGLNRVAEYRNHWSDVIAGFLVGISIAVFLVSTNFFKYNLFLNQRV